MKYKVGQLLREREIIEKQEFWIITAVYTEFFSQKNRVRFVPQLLGNCKYLVRDEDEILDVWDVF